MSISPNSASPKPTSLADDLLRAAWRRGQTPRARLTLVEWAERYRRLSRESSNGGRFLVSRVEVARGPMLAVTEPGVRTITLMACTQLLKTTFIENVIGYFAHLDPCPMLVIQPKDDAAETFGKDRLAPMIRDTPVLRRVFGSARSRDAGNTMTHKQFEGGHVTVVGANSPINLAMRPIRNVLADEINKYGPSAGDEGDAVLLAEERQAEFTDTRLSVRACSPTTEGRIETSYLDSDQRQPFVACPHCDAWQVLEWESVKWEKDQHGKVRLDTVHLYCTGCGVGWSEADRLQALRLVSWRQTRPFACCGVQQKAEQWDGEGRVLCRTCGQRSVDNEHAGFWVSKLYAPKQSVRDLVRKFQRVLGQPEGLKTFFNTQLARTWSEGSKGAEWAEVFAKRDDYLTGTVPAGVLILFAGVDVQKDRLEVGIWGFGRNRERWLIEHRVLPGETAAPQVWRELEEMLGETWTRQGVELPVRDWGVDSSHFGPEVAAFVRGQQGRGNVHAVDGLDRSDAAYIGIGNKDVDQRGSRIRWGMKTIRIGVSFCKQELAGQLTLEAPAEEGQGRPPGWVHLPADTPEEVVKQLTSEEFVERIRAGRRRRFWQLRAGRRNEVLDCANYARGLAAMRGWDRWREPRFREIEAQLQPDRVAAAARQEGGTPQRRVIRSPYISGQSSGFGPPRHLRGPRDPYLE